MFKLNDIVIYNGKRDYKSFNPEKNTLYTIKSIKVFPVCKTCPIYTKKCIGNIWISNTYYCPAVSTIEPYVDMSFNIYVKKDNIVNLENLI